MDFSTLQAFAKVVQTGSFTRAAEALHTHKAHLSRSISQLEAELGARLLERTTRSLSLTEVGREFHEHVLGILGAVEQAELAVQHTQAEPRGTLRLTCGVEWGMLAVSEWISEYLRRYPQMKVDAEVTARVVDVVHEGFDLAIRVGALPDSSLAARRLGDVHYGLYAAKAYLKAHGHPASPANLSEHPLLVFSGRQPLSHWTLSRGADTQEVPLTPTLRATNSFVVRDAALNGLGIALLPRLIADPALAQGLLVGVLPEWTPPSMPIHAVFASARYLAPKVRAFIDLAVALQHSPQAAIKPKSR
ncbi:MAG: LysR family transcriptional regulator [Ideonella sp. MAG2]|nr:MAG: LysR family transcriptional regulator [Ideonella sp. MAG2]